MSISGNTSHLAKILLKRILIGRVRFLDMESLLYSINKKRSICVVEYFLNVHKNFLTCFLLPLLFGRAMLAPTLFLFLSSFFLLLLNLSKILFFYCHLEGVLLGARLAYIRYLFALSIFPLMP